jgi:hypothetical protein
MQSPTTNKYSGFGIAGVLIILAVVAVAGIVAWRFYETNKPKTSNQSSANTSSNTSDSTQSGSSQATLQGRGTCLT